MRSSRVEAAGGGAVRANSSTRSFDSRENYRTQELARHLCRSWRGRVRHARKASRYNWLFPIALTCCRQIAIGYFTERGRDKERVSPPLAPPLY